MFTRRSAPPISPGVSTEKAFEMDVQQLLPSLLMETGTRYSSIQRSTSTYDLCLLRTTVIDCCTPVPGLAPGLAATSTPPLFFSPPYLVSSVLPSRFSYSPRLKDERTDIFLSVHDVARIGDLNRCEIARERKRERD